MLFCLLCRTREFEEKVSETEENEVIAWQEKLLFGFEIHKKSGRMKETEQLK